MLISRNIAIFSLASYTSKRGYNLSKLVAKNVMRMPNKGGLVFSFTWGKTSQEGNGHMFGLECVCRFLEEKGFCASCSVDTYVTEAEALVGNVTKDTCYRMLKQGSELQEW